MQFDFVLRDVDPAISKSLAVLAEMMMHRRFREGFSQQPFNLLNCCLALAMAVDGLEGWLTFSLQRTEAAAGVKAVGPVQFPPAIERLLNLSTDLHQALLDYVSAREEEENT
jgi:hypothetical protein